MSRIRVERNRSTRKPFPTHRWLIASIRPSIQVVSQANPGRVERHRHPTARDVRPKPHRGPMKRRESIRLTALPVPKPPSIPCPKPLSGVRAAPSGQSEQVVVVKRKRQSTEVVRVARTAHGRGIFAERDCDRGEVLFAEAPFLTAPRRVDTDELLRLARRLEKNHLLRLLSWEGGSPNGTSSILAIFLANAIPCVEEEEETEDDAARSNPPAGLFRYASRINHACSPNAGWHWSEQEKKLSESTQSPVQRQCRLTTVIVASHRIKAGDEITVGYCSPEVLRLAGRARRKQILARYLFDCKCPTCAHHPAVRKASDTNRHRLGAILAGWEKRGIDHCLGTARAETLAEVEEAVRLCRTERLAGDLSTIWLQKFYVHAAHAEYDMAKYAARKAVAALSRVRGSYAAQKHWLASYAHDPAAWETYGICIPTQR